MIVEKILEKFQNLSIEDKISELQKYNELVSKGYVNIDKNVLKLMETIVNNELIDKEIMCQDGVCEIKSVVFENDSGQVNIEEKIDITMFQKLIYYILLPYFTNVEEIFGKKFDDEDEITIGNDMIKSNVLNFFKSLHRESKHLKQENKFNDILFSKFHIENGKKINNEVNQVFLDKLRNAIKNTFEDVDFDKFIVFKLNRKMYSRIKDIFKDYDISIDGFNARMKLNDLVKIPFFAILFGIVLFYSTKKRKLVTLKNLKSIGIKIYENEKLNKKIYGTKINDVNKIIKIYDRLFDTVMDEKRVV